MSGGMELLTEGQMEALIVAAASVPGGASEEEVQRIIEVFEAAVVTMKLLDLAERREIALRWNPKANDIRAMALPVGPGG